LLADRIGRVRTLQITIIWFAVFTFLSGFTQTIHQLMVTRGLMGLGFGGEWAAGSVLMGEVIGARYRGRAVGLVQGGWALGWAAAALLSTLLLSTLPALVAWRAVLWAGLLPAFFVLALRRAVPEPPAFRGARARPPVLAIFAPRFLRTTLLGCLLSTGAQGGYYAITTWLPAYLRDQRHLSVLGSGPYLAVIIAGALGGYGASAFLNDGIGRRPTFLVFALGSLAIVLIYTRLPMTDAMMLVLGAPLGFFASGIFGGMGPLFTELFPHELRGSGQGFCYNSGRAAAAALPPLVGIASAHMPLGEAIGLFAGAAYALVIVAVLQLPETRGLALRGLADADVARP
jgi:MFS family permease